MKPGSFVAVCTSLLFMVALLPVQSFSPPTVAAPVSLGEVVYTVPLRKEVAIEQYQQEWYHEFIDATANDSLFAPLFDKVRSKSLTVYKPVYPFTEKMNADSAIGFLDVPFTTGFEDPNTFEIVEMVLMEAKYPSSIVAIIFHEEWMYDASTSALKKIVKGIVPVMDYGLVYTGETYEAIVKPTFYIPFPGTSLQKSDFRLNEITYDLQNDSVGLTDYLDMFRCVSQASTQSPNGSRTTGELIASLKTQCALKSRVLYNSTYPFNVPLTKKERSTTLAAIDSTHLLRFHESWSVDIASMTFTKEIRGVLLGKSFEEVFSYDVYPFYGLPTKFAVYLPLNGYNPSSSTVKRPVYVENIHAGVAYQRMPWVFYAPLVTTDSTSMASCAAAISDKAKSGVYTIYGEEEMWKYDNPTDPGRIALTLEQRDNLFTRHDTALYESEDGDMRQVVLATLQDPADYAGFSFYESWYFDPTKLIFKKQIKSVGLLRYVFNNYGETKGVSAMFLYDNVHDSILQPKYLLGRNILSRVLISWNVLHPNENESSSLIVNYVESYDEQITNENRYLMVQQVINAVLSGKMVAWTTDQPSKPFTVPQFKTMLDTAAARSGAHPPVGLEYYVFNELTFDEDWYHNPATGQFHKKVNAITFGHQLYIIADENTGIFPPDPVYFTIKVNGTK